MKETQTKESFIVEIAKLKQSYELLVAEDERKREEFARAFNWNKYGSAFADGEKKPRTPSWEEIFVEVGRLLSAQKSLQYVSDIENLKLRVREHDIALKERNLKNPHV